MDPPLVAQVYHVQGKAYTVAGKLGEGAYGMVHGARDEAGRPVAVKKSSAQEASDQRDLKREVAIMTTLKHPNLCPAVAAEAKKRGDSMVVLIVMPYARHGNLVAVINAHLKRGTHFSEQRILAIMASVSAGVAELHAQPTPIAHRDMKAENVLVFGDGGADVKLCDFGSTATHSFHCQTYRDITFVEEDLDRKTTLAYRAPEQCDIMGKKRMDEKVDNWALGVILYLLCFFDCPFPDSAVAIINASVSIPQKFRGKYSDDLTEVLHWIFNKNAATRPTAQMIHRRCCRLLNRDPTAKAPSDTPQPQHPSLTPVTEAAQAPPVAPAPQVPNLFKMATAAPAQPQVNLFAQAPQAAAAPAVDLFANAPPARDSPPPQPPAQPASAGLFGMLDWQDSAQAPAPAAPAPAAADPFASPPVQQAPPPGGDDGLFPAQSNIDTMLAGSGQSPSAPAAAHNDPFGAMMVMASQTPPPRQTPQTDLDVLFS